MISGRGIGGCGAGNVIYSESDAMTPIGDVAFVHSTLSIAPGGASGRASDTVTPGTTDSGIGHGVMVGVVHSDGNGGAPFTALIGARPIQVTDVHDG